MLKRQFALVGYPLGHSCSPEIHRELFALSKSEPSSYRLMEIPHDKILKTLPMLYRLDGFNVTIPHKIIICRALKTLDNSAKLYGAVNTVKRFFNGDCAGYNTDVFGFLHALEAANMNLNENVLMLGCGGAGHMMATETALHGGNLTIAVRASSLQKAQNLKQNIGTVSHKTSVTVTTIDKIPDLHYNILLNATPCGMYPNTSQMPVSADLLKQVDNVFDAIYNPSQTMLMKAAQMAGANTAGGMSMLVWQAVGAHEIWDGVTYKAQDINHLIHAMNQKFNC